MKISLESKHWLHLKPQNAFRIMQLGANSRETFLLLYDIFEIDIGVYKVGSKCQNDWQRLTTIVLLTVVLNE